MAPGSRPSSKKKSSITRSSGPSGGTACFKTSPFRAGLHCASATDRNDIAKTSISSPAISSIRFPWTISQGLCAATLLRSYDTEVSVREPKVVNDLDGVGMRRWTVSVNTNIARPDLPKQRIKLEIASVPAHTSTVRRVAVNYPELAGMYDDLTIRCQTLEEILADKLISFSATDTHIRHRDLWDIPWIVRAQEIDFPAVAVLVAAKHDDYRCPVPLASMIAVGMQRAHVCYADGSFTGQMQRFLSPAVLDRTHDFDNHCDALNAIVEKCYGRVAASLGISDQVEHARRRLATEISSGSISSAVLPKRTLGLS